MNTIIIKIDKKDEELTRKMLKALNEYEFYGMNFEDSIEGQIEDEKGDIEEKIEDVIYNLKDKMKKMDDVNISVKAYSNENEITITSGLRIMDVEISVKQGEVKTKIKDDSFIDLTAENAREYLFDEDAYDYSDKGVESLVYTFLRLYQIQDNEEIKSLLNDIMKKIRDLNAKAKIIDLDRLFYMEDEPVLVPILSRVLSYEIIDSVKEMQKVKK